MEGMILAAGTGSRLGSLTDRIPKALVKVGEQPLLGWVVDAMVNAGVHRIIVNTHHHAEQISAFVQESTRPGVTFALSPEPDGPYETGGGLFRAAPLFEEKHPFLLHNADVLSTIPLDSLIHRHQGAIVSAGHRLISSLAVQRRVSERVLLFDDHGLLGWENRGSDQAADGRYQAREPVGAVSPWAFTGIHVVDPAIFELSSRTGSFSIITLYLELAAAGWVINPTDVSDEEWFDIGTPERLKEARLRFGRV
jgi:NDP-sugar pyrophosphorylase family protein